MVDINFELPINRSELLDNFRSGYSIKYLSSVSEIPKKLKDAYICLKEESVMYILENFDVYYSVLHYSDRLSKELIIKAYDDLECAVAELNNRIKYILDDKDNLTDDLKAKMLLIIKMLIYIYTQFIQYLDEKNNSNHDLVVKGKIKPKNNPTLYDLNKAKILLLLNNLIQQQINLFWQPPLVEDTFLNIIAEIGYILLRNPSIKHEKNQLLNEIFGLFGNLIKSHNYGTTFIIRIVQSIKIIEHLPNIVADGVKFLIEHFKCNELIHYLIREATEWQTEDGYEDTQGARYCSQFLTNLATTMPDLILPELEYLDRYLYHESVPLRTSILNMYTEVLLNVLTKHDLNLKEKESRDMLLSTLFEHIDDVAANVRSKVIQNLSRLQENNSIPLTLQNKLLERIIKHLYDKTALVRKASIQSITIFLSYNSYGADLQLKRMQNELERKTEMLNKIEEQYINEKMKYLNEMEEKWLKIQQQLHNVIKIELENDDEDDNDDDNVQIDVKTIQTLLNQQDFVKAFKLCRKLDHECTDNQQLTQIKNNGDEVDFYMFVLKTIYLNITNTLDQLRLNFGMSKEDLEKIKTLEKQITYCKQTTDFLILIDSTLEPMKDLLFTETISDMHSAIEFFITAFRFNIDNTNDGILTMLNLMKENEQERKDAVINAYQKIFLTTTSKNLEDHTTTVVNNLINLLDNLPVESIDDFKNILSNWSKKRMIGNDIIDMLWKYFTKNLNNINDKQSCSATDLLYITSLGRKSIIEKNLKLVSTIGFGQRGRDDLLFLASSCRLLTTICNEQIDITSKQLPYRFNYNDDIFNDLIQILVDLFMEPVQYYLEAFREAINFIYKTSSKPSANCEKLFNEISIKLNDRIDHPHYILIRLFSGIGNIALRQLSFLDDTVYRELKRRHNCHESEKENRKLNQKNKQINNKRTSIFNKNRSSQISMIEESILEGAQAEDVNAEFILNVIENDLLSSKNFLGRFSELLIKFCSKSNLYNDPIVQGVAVNTLARYMLISNKFCKDNIRLFFTILERTNQPEIKCTILIHCVDLITRFSNDVEPWIGRIYDQLKNDNVRVRKFAFFSISNLILRDMIRTSNYISELALCLIDETDEIRSLGKQFFIQLSQKDNNLANLIPDIFSHLIKMENLNEENLRYIMKFLFDFVNNTKHMEALVGRFVVKLNLQYNEKDARNIMYCLSLITYSDKALKKLQDNFGLYKNILHIEEVYTFIKQILNECNKIKPGKPDLRPIVAEIEANIQTVFENDGTKPPIITKPMINNRNRRKKPKNRKRKSNNNHNNDDDSDDDHAKNQSATTSKIDRPKRRRQAKQIVDDTSDTD